MSARHHNGTNFVHHKFMVWRVKCEMRCAMLLFCGGSQPSLECAKAINCANFRSLLSHSPRRTQKLSIWPKCTKNEKCVRRSPFERLNKSDVQPQFGSIIMLFWVGGKFQKSVCIPYNASTFLRFKEFRCNAGEIFGWVLNVNTYIITYDV